MSAFNDITHKYISNHRLTAITRTRGTITHTTTTTTTKKGNTEQDKQTPALIDHLANTKSVHDTDRTSEFQANA